MSDPELPEALRDELRASWHRYLDLVAPLRPALHGYCRRLTGDVWDGEDLVQDTLVRAFATLGAVHHDIRNPRAYLLRTATHVWIDALRRRRSEQASLAAQASVAERAQPLPPSDELRDAGALLLHRLSPQERAAVVLKDLFDMELEEIAEVLRTSVGAVKAALHRGRGRLRDPEEKVAAQRARPSVELVDRFVALYNAKDVNGLIALMLDSGSVENVGSSLEYGHENFPRRDGWFQHAVFGHDEWPAEFHYESARLERALLAGEPVALGFAVRRGREALEQVLRFEEEDGRIARLRGYSFCPETMREVGAELGLRVRGRLYRYPSPAPGKLWTKP